MPMTEGQRAQLRPLLPDLRARCEGLASPERAEFATVPAALARPAETA